MMSGSSRYSLAAAAIAVGFGLSATACGFGGTDDSPTDPPQRLSFHPCEGFGDEALSAAGIDAVPPERFEDKEEPFQSWACSYYSYEPYSSVLVSSQGISLSDVESDDRFSTLEEVEIAGHRTLVQDFPGGLQCLVSVELDPGVLEVVVGYKAIDIETADQACSLALQVAEDLAPYFPEHL